MGCMYCTEYSIRTYVQREKTNKLTHPLQKVQTAYLYTRPGHCLSWKKSLGECQPNIQGNLIPKYSMNANKRAYSVCNYIHRFVVISCTMYVEIQNCVCTYACYKNICMYACTYICIPLTEISN